jgi:hypothetical protein
MKIFKTVIFLMYLMVFCTSMLQAQSVAINSTGASPDNSASLDVSANNKGILIPRVALSNSLDVTTILAPATSLLVYNTATAGTSPNQVLPGYYFWNGSKWVDFISSTGGGGIVGEIRTMIQAADFDGWIVLDGRAVSTLTPSQQVVALTLGFTSTIPDASNTYLTQNGNGLGSVVGSNSVVLTQANLPNINFNGNTNSAGTHTHTTSQMVSTNNANTNGSTFVTDNNVYVADNTSLAGEHTHTATVSSGGSNSPINKTPQTISVKMFIYLGF